MGYVDPVPESGCFPCRDRRNRRMTLFVEPTLGDQSGFEFIEHPLDLGLQSVDVEVLRAGVASLAGRDIPFEGVVGAVTDVTGRAGSLHQRGVRTRIAFKGKAIAACTGQTEQHGALGTVVGTPVGAGDLNHSIDNRVDPSTWLVTSCAQVALAAVEGHTFEGEELYRFGSCKCPVGARAGRMDLMAGSTVLAGRGGVALLDPVPAGAPRDHVGECSPRRAGRP